MIANKHTELRLVSNLNDLLEDSKTKQEINKKIHRFTYDYLMEYIDIQRTEEGRELFDIFEELGDYHLHTLEIAKRIRDNILGSIDYLDPKKYTKAYKSDLLEDIENKVVDNYFKELNNVINNFEYIKKIDNLRKEKSKKTFEDNKKDIEDIVKGRIESNYRECINSGHLAKDILYNFEYNQETKRLIEEDILNSISRYLDTSDFDEYKAINLIDKRRKEFVRDKKAMLGIKYNDKKNKQVNIKVPKTVKWYAITRVWKDILK